MPSNSSRSIAPLVLFCLSAIGTASHAQDSAVSQDGVTVARVEVSAASGAAQREADTAA
jgi:hypothetical protein